MARISLEKANADLAELSTILHTWDSSRDSDSVQTQRSRINELSVGERMLEDLVLNVQPESELRLLVGSTAILGSSFDKGAYDFYSESNKLLEPGSELQLIRADWFTSEFPDMSGRDVDRMTLFVGNFVDVLRIDRVAEALRDGGALAVVGVDATTDAS